MVYRRRRNQDFTWIGVSIKCLINKVNLETLYFVIGRLAIYLHFVSDSSLSLFSVLWIRHTTVENRLNIMELMAEEIADRFVEMSEGQPIPKGDVPGYLNDRGRFMDLESDPLISIVDTYGNTLTTNRPQDRMLQFSEVLLNEEKTVQELNNDATKEAFYVVKVPITYQDATVGWVVMLESKANLAEVNQEYRLLAMMIIGLALIGWTAIYFLSKRLSKPIQEVAEAAREIQAGIIKLI